VTSSPVALVTGAGGGLGRALATVLDEAGFDLVLIDVSESVLDPTSTARDHHLRVVGDVTDDAVLAAVVAETINRFARLDLLVNNAGRVRFTPVSAPIDVARQSFDELWRVNTRAPFVLGRLVIPHMIERGEGHIVNVSTDHVHTCGFPNVIDHADAVECPWHESPRRPFGGVVFDAYDASKWALNGLTQVWSAALRRHGIRVNNLCLGATDTDMVRQAIREMGGREPDESDIASWMSPTAVARLVLELHDEGPNGRSGDNLGVWIGHPLRLPPAHPVLSRPPDVR
jgi:NAD(P)-dependent dehydrogenase (short-subunit alcohol dehydrogenase family)